MTTSPRHIRVFISSPGDVPDERRIAAKVVNDLPFDPLLKGRITTEVVAWDQPGSATPIASPTASDTPVSTDTP